ncbi:MAG: hypothetical protein V3W45_07010, partial [Sedimentisphaerales bacterium]
IIDYEYRHADRLRASPNNRVVTRPSEKFEGNYYMQNKPNFRNDKMNINSAITKDYGNIPPIRKCQNKPNQSQFQPKNAGSTENKPNFSPKTRLTNPIKPNLSPKTPLIWAICHLSHVAVPGQPDFTGYPYFSFLPI